MKIMRTLVATAIAVAGMATPAHAFDIDYPQACQPDMSHILYYDDGYGPENQVSGAEVHWCNNDITYLGGPAAYSWTEWCDPCD